MSASKRRKRRAWLPAIAPLILTTLICATTEARERQLCVVEFFLGGTGAAILCEQPMNQAVVDTACDAFEPIRYSRRDTPETIERARKHNAAWDALCKK